MKDKNPFIVVLIISVGILIMTFLLSGTGNEGFAITGLAGFFLAPVELLIGIVLAIFGKSQSQTRKYGQAFMIMSVLMLLCGFSLCSSG